MQKLKRIMNELGNRGDKQSIKEEQLILSSLEAKLKKDMENQRFRMEHKEFTPDVKVRPHRMSKTKVEFRCKMLQLSVNLNDATTGHRLQGMCKDVIIIMSWPKAKGGMSKNWEYVVLSRVLTQS